MITILFVVSRVKTQNWYQEFSKLKVRYESLQRSHSTYKKLLLHAVKTIDGADRRAPGKIRITYLLHLQQRQLEEVNRKLKDKFQVEGSSSRVIQGCWESKSMAEGKLLPLNPCPANAVYSEPTLQIGYYQQFGRPEAATTRDAAEENNFMVGWVP
ncbi:hypothetical protein GW17_00043337 [Ensete ventricosum]|nr:hypothetical protein GW17_00043337 [Ensete ventricosum]